MATNFTGWETLINGPVAAGKTFRVGDTLEFKYGPSHSVDVVNKAGYDGCDDSSATENHSDGDTKIDLKTVARTKVFYLSYTWSLSRCHEASHYGRSLPSSPPTPESPPPSDFVAPPPTTGDD
ncbi:Phytocyanin domain [Arabidopsis thaliana x Arabidopsis arenosa]|uniref:Phytocyanin domain n=1 Tax=Arabidopsis thaliana x Arabidopsis arenosa TaxID=1240361 RepID=A0A8T2AEL0_9BRAS|nr:Phytocyanin domain [Arabidopsis thaliana x Arabidopsis arenosa]